LKLRTIYHKHLPEDEIITIYKVEKNGIRRIEGITGFHRDTIGKLLENMAAKEMNRYLIKSLGLIPFECNELRSTAKKQKKGPIELKKGCKDLHMRKKDASSQHFL